MPKPKPAESKASYESLYGKRQFSVYQFFSEANYEKVAEFVSAEEAVKLMMHYTDNVATRMGLTQRVIITDGSDSIVYEWKLGEGTTFPPTLKKGKLPCPDPSILTSQRTGKSAYRLRWLVPLSSISLTRSTRSPSTAHVAASSHPFWNVGSRNRKPRPTSRRPAGAIRMPEIDIASYAAMPPNDLEARRRAIVLKAAGQHDNLTIDELHELAAITGVLRRRASGPPKTAKPKATKASSKPAIADLA